MKTLPLKIGMNKQEFEEWIQMLESSDHPMNTPENIRRLREENSKREH